MFFVVFTVPSTAQSFQDEGRRKIVSWCLEPSQPQRTILGLRENFIKRHAVERTNKAEMRPEELSEEAESFRENLWNEIQLTGP